MVAPIRPSDQNAAEDDSALDELESEELELEDFETVDLEEELAESPSPVLHPQCLEENQICKTFAETSGGAWGATL